MIVLAMWCALTFHAPAGDSLAGSLQPVVRYELRQQDEYFTNATRLLYAAANTSSGEPAPSAPGAPETIWFQCSEDSRPRMYRLYSIDAAGNKSDPSNPVVILAGALPDTFYIALDGTTDRNTGKAFVWSRPAPTEPGKYLAAWSRVPGDSAFTILPHWRASLLTSSPTLSGRAFQLKDSPAACATTALFGTPYWAEADEYRACP